MKNRKSNGISTLLLTVLFRISTLIRTFSLLTGLLTCRNCYLPNWKKNKIENLCFLLPSFIIFIIIMDQDIKHNKKSALVHQYRFSSKLQGGI